MEPDRRLDYERPKPSTARQSLVLEIFGAVLFAGGVFLWFAKAAELIQVRIHSYTAAMLAIGTVAMIFGFSKRD